MSRRQQYRYELPLFALLAIFVCGAEGSPWKGPECQLQNEDVNSTDSDSESASDSGTTETTTTTDPSMTNTVTAGPGGTDSDSDTGSTTDPDPTTTTTTDDPCADCDDAHCMNNVCVCLDDNECGNNAKCVAGACEPFCMPALMGDDICDPINGDYCKVDVCAGDGEYPVDCAELLDWGYTANGSYWIDPNGDGNIVQVLCDFTDPPPCAGAEPGWTGWTFAAVQQEFFADDPLGGLECTYDVFPYTMDPPPELSCTEDASLDDDDHGCNVGPNGPWSRAHVEMEQGTAHTCHYTFPFEFQWFRVESYQVQATCIGTDCVIDSSKFTQTVWSRAFHPGEAVGDISFGSTQEMGPMISLGDSSWLQSPLAAQANNPAVSISMPVGVDCFDLGAPAPDFRIGWGEAGGTPEGWFPWYSGTIWLR